MTQLNNNKPLDNSSGIGQDNQNEAMNAKKSPWHLRFAPGAILRKSGLIAAISVAAVLSTIETQAATQLTPEQIENKRQSTLRLVRILRSSRTNQVSTTPRKSIPSRVRTTPPPRPTTPATSTPAAVPVPVVVVAKPVLKRGAVVAGKWLIAVLAEYGVHSALDRVFQNNKDQEANVTVHGALWLSNEYFWRTSSPHTVA